MEIGPDPQQKVISALEGALLFVVHEVAFRERDAITSALDEVGAPEQIMVVAQTAGARLDVGFLQGKPSARTSDAG